jgi:superfamily I DNA/RNA helicase|tara:strand:- start:434 stop:1957 length:1524 start_codon:yes stop_codon:yes gene_type:complete
METTIFGPPGTGKTTTLLNIVDDALQGGMNPSRIGFVSFSKKAATEAKERALQKFGIDPKYLTHFRTLHSMAFQYLGLRSQDVMKGADYTELSTLVGLPFSSHASLTMDDGLLFKAGRGGDAYLNLINLARARQVSVETQYHQLNDWRIQLRQLRVIDGALTSYKSAKGKMDFVDMIEQFVEGGEGPHFDLLIVDEAQDLVPLQWRMVKDILVPRSERTYYAGDDDQCIYSWMGVDVQDFMKSCDDVRVLSKSYRLPAPVYNVAQNIVKRVSLRQEKHWSPNDHDGSVNWHYDILDVDIRSGEWLILGRTNNIVNRVGTMLKEQGFVFWREGRGKNGWSVSPNTLEALEVWLRLCRGETFSSEELKQFGKFMRKEAITPAGKRRLNNLDPEETYTLDDIIEKCSLLVTRETHWSQVIKVSDREVTYITSVRRSGEKILGNSKPRIRLSTIHAAKGGESDNVILLTETNTACEKSLDQDGEARCFYVGATRAKKNLHIVESGNPRYKI